MKFGEKRPADFNWVEARSKCRTKDAFETLYEDVKRDVAAAELIAARSIKYEIGRSSERSFFVKQIENIGGFQAQRSVRFDRKSDSIEVSSHFVSGTVPPPDLSASPELSEDGDPCYRVDGEQKEPWQFRRKALDPVFFALPEAD